MPIVGGEGNGRTAHGQRPRPCRRDGSAGGNEFGVENVGGDVGEGDVDVGEPAGALAVEDDVDDEGSAMAMLFGEK